MTGHERATATTVTSCVPIVRTTNRNRTISSWLYAYLFGKGVCRTFTNTDFSIRTALEFDTLTQDEWAVHPESRAPRDQRGSI